MKKKILIVDDEITTCVLLEHLLSSKYEVITKESGIDALIWLECNLPDLIISDIQMMNMNGLEFLYEVRI
jgi:CheY-like chemotaxis protein